MQLPDPNKNYVPYTGASNNAYSGVLCQPISNGQDIRPVVYFSDTFTPQNKSWCATKKEAYAVLKNIQKFNYYLRGTNSTLRCDHKPLDPFLTRGMKIAKLDRWAMLLQEYIITFVHIRGKDNILLDAISRLHTINVYDDTVENKQNHSLGIQNTAHSELESWKHTAAWFPQHSHNCSTEVLQHWEIYKNKISFIKIEYVSYMQT